MRVLLLGARRGINENNWKDGIADAGERLGWDITHINAGPVPRQPGTAPTCEDIIAQAKGMDLLLWARTHGHNPVGDVEAMLRRIEESGTVTAGLHMDLYWGIERREVEIGVDPWWSQQHIFTADGGPRDWGKVNHHWCPPAMDYRFLGRGRYQKRLRHCAVFVGSVIPNIHGSHRRSLMMWARSWARPRGGFMHYGTGSGGRMWGQNLSDLYASVDVVLGDSAPAPFYWSDRLPITMGRGGLLAYPETDGLTEQGFTSDHMVLFKRGDFRGLGRKLEALSPGRWREMTDAALTLVEERHMWTNRLRMIAEVTGCA